MKSLLIATACYVHYQASIATFPHIIENPAITTYAYAPNAVMIDSQSTGTDNMTICNSYRAKMPFDE